MPFRSYYWRSIVFSIITCSSWLLSLRHSSIYTVNSISISCDFVIFMLRFSCSISLSFSYTSSFKSLLFFLSWLTIKLSAKWWLSELLLFAANDPGPSPPALGWLRVCYNFIVSFSSSLSLEFNSCWICCNFVFNLVFSSLVILFVILRLR